MKNESNYRYNGVFILFVSSNTLYAANRNNKQFIISFKKMQKKIVGTYLPFKMYYKK